MKVVIKTKESGTRVAQKNIVWTDFDDRDIDKLFIKSGNRKDFKFLKILAESAFINAETRGLTHRTIWCNISKKLEREKLNEKYNELH